MRQDPEVEVTLYEVGGLLTWEQMSLMLHLINEHMDVAEDERDFDLMGELLALRSLLLATEMEAGKSFGEMIVLLNEPNKIEQ